MRSVHKLLVTTFCVLVVGAAFVPAGLTVANPETTHIEHVQREIEGWTVHVDQHLLSDRHQELRRRGLRILANELYKITLVVPEANLERLREVPIFVDLDHPLKNLQYHPDIGWLRDHGYDEAMARSVHIPRIQRLVDLTQQNTQPWAVLHELAHAFHDRVLGFDHRAIQDAYDRIVAGKQYESVLHISGRSKRHYALTNHKEFFAEMTECYFGTNDFYPFVRAELADFDPKTYALMETIWKNPHARRKRNRRGTPMNAN